MTRGNMGGWELVREGGGGDRTQMWGGLRSGPPDTSLGFSLQFGRRLE